MYRRFYICPISYTGISTFALCFCRRKKLWKQWNVLPFNEWRNTPSTSLKKRHYISVQSKTPYKVHRCMHDPLFFYPQWLTFFFFTHYNPLFITVYVSYWRHMHTVQRAVNTLIQIQENCKNTWECELRRFTLTYVMKQHRDGQPNRKPCDGPTYIVVSNDMHISLRHILSVVTT